jgi:hypothetical protein
LCGPAPTAVAGVAPIPKSQVYVTNGAATVEIVTGIVAPLQIEAGKVKFAVGGLVTLIV